MKINIGTTINLDLLIDSRMLVQARSGGGKSYAIRKLCEEAAGKVPIILLDLEGEFVTLRKMLDCIYFGKEGDALADIRYAEKIATSILELNVSAIIDLYELKHHERILFVKRFLNSMINAPKELWHPALVIVDEAHVFCPEKGKAESMGAVIDLCTRGRKRGYCAVLATQRLSKLHKDAAAECNNKMIGGTGLDVDMKRASEELGFTTKADMLSLRDLSPGEFFVFGPAISNTIEKIKISKVKTEHPKSGRRTVTVPPASAAIKKMIEKLQDIPKEAEKEFNTIKDYKFEINNLKKELREEKKKSKNIIDAEEYKALSKENYRLKSQLNKVISSVDSVISGVKKYAGLIIEKIESTTIEVVPSSQPVKPVRSLPQPEIKVPMPKVAVPINSSDGTLGRCPTTILKFLALRPDKAFSKPQVGAMTNYSPRSGGFNNAISQLATRGLIIRNSGMLQLNRDMEQEAIEILGDEYSSREQYSKEAWLNTLGVCPRNIYQVLLNEPDREFAKDELGELTGYSSGSGGFNNGISKLCTLGLAERNAGMIKLNSELLEI